MEFAFSDPMIVEGLNTSVSLLLKVRPDPENNFIEFSAQDLAQLLSQKEESTPELGPFVHLDNWAPSPVTQEVNLYASLGDQALNPEGCYYVILTADIVSDLEDYFAAQPPLRTQNSNQQTPSAQPGAM